MFRMGKLDFVTRREKNERTWQAVSKNENRES